MSNMKYKTPTPGERSLVAHIILRAIQDLQIERQRSDALSFLRSDGALVAVSMLDIRWTIYQKWINDNEFNQSN